MEGRGVHRNFVGGTMNVPIAYPTRGLFTVERREKPDGDASLQPNDVCL